MRSDTVEHEIRGNRVANTHWREQAHFLLRRAADEAVWRHRSPTAKEQQERKIAAMVSRHARKADAALDTLESLIPALPYPDFDTEIGFLRTEAETAT